jgi:hypothetical protein
MKLRDVLQNYYDYSGKASDIIRQLGLGGIAIIWIFHIGNPGVLAIPESLFLPLKLIILGLAFDLLQYAVGALVWSVFHWRKEQADISQEEDFKAPSSINWPAILFFYSKTLLILVAYWYIFKYLSVAVAATG